MALPLDILDEIGQTYGPTRELHQTLANLVAATIQNLEHARNGGILQRVSFGPCTQNLGHPALRLPLRIDESFYKTATPATAARPQNEPLPPNTSNGRRPWPSIRDHPIASLPWPANVLHSAIQSETPANSANDTNDATGPLDDPVLWGSLETTGGWDDFLNAIAM